MASLLNPQAPQLANAPAAPPILSQTGGPISTLYQSARLPPLPQNSAIPSQPFLGFSSLGLPSSTQQANQGRRASALATLPRQQQVARRGSRSMAGGSSGSGRRSAAPALVRRSVRGRIQDCLVEGSEPGDIRIQAIILPPTVCYFVFFFCTGGWRY